MQYFDLKNENNYFIIIVVVIIIVIIIIQTCIAHYDDTSSMGCEVPWQNLSHFKVMFDAIKGEPAENNMFFNLDLKVCAEGAIRTASGSLFQMDGA